jgi:flavin reductase (DIM6/NTAB) family NADH-FMN oxidoreductase RutF/DNA-binding IclR family transcriptional regulator
VPTSVDPIRFRQVLGQYPTGVAVVTATGPHGEPIGMTVGSFTSVSLDPPLVAFLPDKRSGSWQAMRTSGKRFCVNVLGADQEEVCRAMAARGAEKFGGIDWRLSPHGNPLITGSVAYIDCLVEAVHDAGDHDIVVGRVQHLDVENSAYPLLFFRGGYGSFTPLSLAAGDADLLDQLRLVDVARPLMEELAAEFDTEVTAMTVVRDDLVHVATAGRTAMASAPTRVGLRVPFMPPVGSVFAAFGGAAVRERWLGQLDPALPADELEEYRRVPQRVRERGYAITIGHEKGERLESTSARLVAGDPGISLRALRDVITDVGSAYNPEVLDDEGSFELHALTAPVFLPDGSVAFSLTLWGPPGVLGRAGLDARAARLLDTTAAASAAMRRNLDLVAAGHR